MMYYPQSELTVRSIPGTVLAIIGTIVHLLKGTIFSILYLLIFLGKLVVNSCSTNEDLCKFFETENGAMLVHFFERHHWLCLLLVLLEFSTATSLIVTNTRSGSRHGMATGTLMMISSLSLHMIEFGKAIVFVINTVALILALPYFLPLDGALKMMRPISIKRPIAMGSLLVLYSSSDGHTMARQGGVLNVSDMAVTHLVVIIIPIAKWRCVDIAPPAP